MKDTWRGHERTLADNGGQRFTVGQFTKGSWKNVSDASRSWLRSEAQHGILDQHDNRFMRRGSPKRTTTNALCCRRRKTLYVLLFKRLRHWISGASRLQNGWTLMSLYLNPGNLVSSPDIPQVSFSFVADGYTTCNFFNRDGRITDYQEMPSSNPRVQGEIHIVWWVDHSCSGIQYAARYCHCRTTRRTVLVGVIMRWKVPTHHGECSLPIPSPITTSFPPRRQLITHARMSASLLLLFAFLVEPPLVEG